MDTEEKPNYTDHDITFLMGMYQDRGRAEGALDRIRTYFPDARIVVRSDGDDDPLNRSLSDKYDLTYLQEKRLYPIENGGALVARTLEIFLQNPTRYLLKLDTDTAVFRRFRFLPVRNCIFGSIQTNKQGNHPSIQGGFIGFSRESVEKIVQSRVLEDERLKDPFAYRYDSGYLQRMGRRVHRTGLCSFDWMVGWAASELGIRMYPFREVRSRWHPENTVPNDDLRFAVMHPVYF